jgi:hypothetical protein
MSLKSAAGSNPQNGLCPFEENGKFQIFFQKSAGTYPFIPLLNACASYKRFDFIDTQYSFN